MRISPFRQSTTDKEFGDYPPRGGNDGRIWLPQTERGHHNSDPSRGTRLALPAFRPRAAAPRSSAPARTDCRLCPSGPTPPTLCRRHSLRRNHSITDLAQCLVERPDKFLLDSVQFLPLAKNCANTLGHTLECSCHTHLLSYAGDNVARKTLTFDIIHCQVKLQESLLRARGFLTDDAGQ